MKSRSLSRRMPGHLGMALAAAWFLAVVVVWPIPEEAVEAAGAAELVGSHPHASQQPTPEGAVIGGVDGFEGRLYFGYGDGVRNTGPIVISSYDPASGTWADHLTFQTEVVNRFRVISDELWAPAVDPRGGLDLGYAAGGAGREWKQHPLKIGTAPGSRSGPLHIFDAATLATGEGRFLSGSFFSRRGAVSTEWAGVVHSTTAGGGGWEISLSVPGRSAPRFYNLGVVDGKLYTVLGGLAGSGKDLRSDPDVGEASYVYHRQRWGRGPPLDGFIRPVGFADVLVYRSKDGGMRAFDGETVRDLGLPGSRSHASDDHRVVALADGLVHSTVDLRTWKIEGTAPATAKSIGLLDGVCYLGTSTGEVYRLLLGS